jgi:hypothetical protein
MIPLLITVRRYIFSKLKIAKKFPNKKNGFFWVKPFCHDDAIRVYCDFSSKIFQYYAYIGLDDLIILGSDDLHLNVTTI